MWWKLPSVAGSLNFNFPIRDLEALAREALIRLFAYLLVTAALCFLMPRISLRQAALFTAASVATMYFAERISAVTALESVTNGGRLMAPVLTHVLVLTSCAMLAKAK